MPALRAIHLALKDIKLAHTVFALPFALLAAALAISTLDPQPSPQHVAALIALIVLCMFFARTWAMLVNRLADAAYDAQNPRTAERAVAAGELSPRAGWRIALATAAIFWATTLAFLAFDNPWPAILAPAVLIWIAAYAYTKRFTALCHLFLGSALALSPICAAIAIDPATIFPLETSTLLPLLLLSTFIACWVAGFDIPYALADIDIDRTLNLHSVPARFGVRRALWISRALHTLAVIAVIAFAVTAPPLGFLTLAASAAVAALLAYEHRVLATRGVDGLPIAFLTINGVISILFSAAAITDTLI